MGEAEPEEQGAARHFYGRQAIEHQPGTSAVWQPMTKQRAKGQLTA